MPEACPYSNGVGTRLCRVQEGKERGAVFYPYAIAFLFVPFVQLRGKENAGRQSGATGLVIPSAAMSCDDIATSFRTWTERSPFTPLSCRVSTPTIKQGRHGLCTTTVRRDGRGGQKDKPEACPYNNDAVAFQ